jgi:acyl-CoA reductase-like NAD-dependent aldehyde dehydrogenase
MMRGCAMTIDGTDATSAEIIEVTDPATELVAGRVPACSPAQLDEAFAAAARAQPGWAASEEDRRKAVRRLADLVESATGELAALITVEQGRSLAGSAREVASGVSWLRYFADLQLPEEVVQDDNGTRAVLTRKPLGAVAAITPWNFPLGLPLWKLGPALVAGNTVVLKPSPDAPLACLRLGEIARSAVPPGVVNVVAGGAGVGQRMVTHPTPRKISMTGSTAAGKAIAAAAGAQLKRLTLELGGNDAAIVLADADIQATAAGIAAIAMFNAGQACTAVKRVYVDAAIHGDFVDALVAEVARLVVGPGTDPAATLGPVSTRAQYDRVTCLLGEALESGARAVTGGRALPGPGWFVEPTVLVEARAGMRIVDEEQFGPVLPVLSFADVSDAVAQANGTPFGLGGSVWGGDVDRAAQVAARLECGLAWVNAHSRQAPWLPFAGLKDSGLGVENGLEGLKEFTSIQVVHRPAAA